MDPRERLIIALDVPTATAARRIVAAVGDSAYIYKVGMQLYTAEGPAVVREPEIRFETDPGHRALRRPTADHRGGPRGGRAGREHADRARLRRRQDAACRS